MNCSSAQILRVQKRNAQNDMGYVHIESRFAEPVSYNPVER